MKSMYICLMRYFLVVLLFTANTFLWSEVLAGETVTFLDIGQGDSILIRTGRGHTILVDGGSDATVLERMSKNLPFWVRTVDLVVPTHADADHLGGLVYVLRRYRVRQLLWNGVGTDTRLFAAWEEAVREADPQVTLAHAPQRVSWGDPTSYLELLYPTEIPEGTALNDTSIVMRLVHPRYPVLLTGDLTKVGERQLLGKAVDARILKVGHHGSKTSTSAAFLLGVRPELAVIQVGKKNKYGHPAQSVLAQLLRYGIQVMRTDEEGDVTLHLSNHE